MCVVYVFVRDALYILWRSHQKNEHWARSGYILKSLLARSIPSEFNVSYALRNEVVKSLCEIYLCSNIYVHIFFGVVLMESCFFFVFLDLQALGYFAWKYAQAIARVDTEYMCRHAEMNWNFGRLAPLCPSDTKSRTGVLFRASHSIEFASHRNWVLYALGYVTAALICFLCCRLQVYTKYKVFIFTHTLPPTFSPFLCANSSKTEALYGNVLSRFGRSYKDEPLAACRPERKHKTHVFIVYYLCVVASIQSARQERANPCK